MYILLFEGEDREKGDREKGGGRKEKGVGERRRWVGERRRGWEKGEYYLLSSPSLFRYKFDKSNYKVDNVLF